MMRPDDEIEDPEIAALFRAAHPPLADAGFVAGVLARLERRERLRQLVLAAAAAAGIALAVVPASQLLASLAPLGRQAADAAVHWSGALRWSDTVHRLSR